MSLKILYKVDTIEKPLEGFVSNDDGYFIRDYLMKTMEQYKHNKHICGGWIEEIKKEAQKELLEELLKNSKKRNSYLSTGDIEDMLETLEKSKFKCKVCGDSKWGFRAGYVLPYYCMSCLYIPKAEELNNRGIDF